MMYSKAIIVTLLVSLTTAYIKGCKDEGYRNKDDCSAAISLLDGAYLCNSGLGNGCSELESVGECPIYCCQDPDNPTVYDTTIIPPSNIVNEECPEDGLAIAYFSNYYIRLGEVNVPV